MKSKISYEPFWRMIRDRGLKKVNFAKEIGISNATLAKLGKDEPVTLTIIEKICDYFNCDICDVVEYVPAKKKAEARNAKELYEAMGKLLEVYYK